MLQEYFAMFLRLKKHEKKEIQRVHDELIKHYGTREDPWGLSLKKAKRSLTQLYHLYLHYFKVRLFNKENIKNKIGEITGVIGKIINSSSNVYFIQLAALFKNKADVSSFIKLKDYGSIYKVQQSNATKVKLGYFMDETQAKDILRKVKRMGYTDAFITYEALNTSRMELVELSRQTTNSYVDSGYSTDTTTGTNYKVRLASYEDPIYFDINKVKDLGVIEQWSKGEWTIFVLSGYGTLAEAEMAKLNASQRGFSGAEVVIDRDGILEKIQ